MPKFCTLKIYFFKKNIMHFVQTLNLVIILMIWFQFVLLILINKLKKNVFV